MGAMRFYLALLCLSLCLWSGVSYISYSPTSWRNRLSLSATIDNDIMIYNTLTRKKEKFESIEENKVSFYRCALRISPPLTAVCLCLTLLWLRVVCTSSLFPGIALIVLPSVHRPPLYA
jgi:hypothetical protein